MKSIFTRDSNIPIGIVRLTEYYLSLMIEPIILSEK